MEVILDGISFAMFGTMLAFGAYCFYVICRIEYYEWLDSINSKSKRNNNA